MKVLHLLNTGQKNFGGKERATLELISGLRSKGVDAQLLCLREGLTDKLAQKMQIPTFVPIVKKPKNFTLISAVARVIRDGKFELVHTHDFRENVIGRLAAKRANVPVVTTLHGLAKLCLELPWIKRFFYHALDVMTAKMSERFIVLSEHDRRLLPSTISQSKIHAIPLALKPIEKPLMRAGKDEKTFVFGGAGRLDKQKGFDILINAAKEILDEYKEVRFVIAGSGPREIELKKLAERLGIADRIEFLGFVEDMDKFYSSLDVLVLPSLVERMPLVVLEAQARGLFVIATDVGAIREMIKDGETGFIVRAGDKKALADAMKKVLENRTFVESARAKVIHLESEFEKMLEETISVYREALR